MPVAAPQHEQLLHWLAEAAELEHNLLCSYLFALFSLKQGTDEDLGEDELEVVNRWRKVLLSVCVEEMAHLAQVANLSVALGARPHFNRPNIPTAPGYHPGSVVIELARFDRDTLSHMIHIERPADAVQPDGASFTAPPEAPAREDRLNLMPSAPPYETIGEFYGIVKEGLIAYARASGSDAFRGPVELQLRAEEVRLDSLLVVRDLAGACAAIDGIVRQGEGGTALVSNSHYDAFVKMREEFDELAKASPEFEPARPVVRNPVMHAPVADDRCHVIAHDALTVLDFANSLYGLMLRCLKQLYETRWAAPAARRAMCASTLLSMKAFSLAGCELTRFEADPAKAGRAGVSFAMLRHTEGFTTMRDAAVTLRRRADGILAAASSLPVSNGCRADLTRALRDLTAQLEAFGLAV